MEHHTLDLPPDLTNWLTTGDRTAELFGDTVPVDRKWWSSELASHGFPDVLCGDRISRTDLFRLGAAATGSPEDAIALLWNTLAFCLGTRNADGRKRIIAVSARRPEIGGLLQQAAALAAEDPAGAYRLLRPDKCNAVDRFGPGGFTWYLYFAGGGNPLHPSQPLEAPVARALRKAGWSTLHAATWTAEEYGEYVRLIDRWRRAAGVDRGDLISSGLYTISPPSGWDYPWQDWRRSSRAPRNWVGGPLSADDLRTVYHWFALLSDVYPDSSAAESFSRFARPIRSALDGNIGEPPFRRRSRSCPDGYRPSVYWDEYDDYPGD